MSELCKLPNVGKILEKRLSGIGINTPEDLKNSGSKDAFMKLYLQEGDTCFSTFCALEGAVQGIRWHNLPKERKQQLKEEFDLIKGKRLT